MPDIETHTINEARFAASTRTGDFELSIDATGEAGPTANQVLVADYASCFTFAVRAGAQRHLDLELGRIETEAGATLDDDDDLESITFTLHIETDLEDEQIDDLRGFGEDLCHVHSALREGLHADVSFEPDAF